MKLTITKLSQRYMLAIFGGASLLTSSNAYAETGGNALGNFLSGLGGIISTGANLVSGLFNTVGTFFNQLGLGSFWRGLLNGIFGVGDCGQVVGGGIGQAVCNMVNSTSSLPGFISAIAYLLGLLFALTALIKLKDHVESPDRHPLSDAVKRFVAGGMLFSLPTITHATKDLITGGKNMTFEYGNNLVVDSGGAFGLDTSLALFVADLWEPLQIAIGAFGYLAGLVLTVVGINRLVKTAQDGPKGPASFGTIMTFVTAGALFSLDGLMGVFSSSIFGSNVIRSYPVLRALSVDGGNVDIHITNVITSILAFVALVGWISFVRGFFIMRDVAEGNGQASLMSASTHLIAGAIAVNLGAFLEVIQNTFGIANGIAFQ